jgi:Glycoside hydrolase family 5 C-terminal domain
VPKPDRILLTSRPYPLYTAGSLRSLRYDPNTGRFAMRGTSRPVHVGDVAGATVIYIPQVVRGPVRARGARVLVARSAGGRIAYAFPAGGAYTVSAN